MTELSSEDRLRLMRFACAFAWADLEIRPEERALIRNLARSLNLSEDEVEEVNRWMVNPPLPEEVDPQDIPMAHRQMFLAAAQAMIAIDGDIDPDEMSFLDLFRNLLLGDEE
jgi:tellurite resistance protein